MDTPVRSVHLSAPGRPEYSRVLTTDALKFLAELSRHFSGRIDQLLSRRRERQVAFDTGAQPDFLPGTRTLREDDWRVAPIPDDLQDRRVEITGPTDRKMIINALNSGASTFMADFEDATSPTWDNLVRGQANLQDAVNRTISFAHPDSGKEYQLSEKPAVLLVRPRGLHLPEHHLQVDGRAVPGALFDFGLYFYHNAHNLLAQGSGPYFYLPKLESHLEAELWNDVFVHAQRALGIPQGSIRATVLIETLPAAFEMHEILYALRDHAGGLNCGRWDYIFSFIKTFHAHAQYVLPDRDQVTMQQPFLRAYTQLVVKTCHRRGIHAMGGMAAQIPIRDDAAANTAAIDKVRADKLREVTDGHDGTWVAHPGLVGVAREVFDEHMPQANQIARQRDDLQISADDLLQVPQGMRSESGLRHNIRIGLQYLEAWLRGQGAVPLYQLMEDAATAEIARAQIWQWLHHDTQLDGGAILTEDGFAAALYDELIALGNELGPERMSEGRFEEARDIFESLVTDDEFALFLTLPAYEALMNIEAQEMQWNKP
ncbi:MAG: malate synthase A [Pseudomonadota bacterium]|nr:MAG: malate synthase A [Pseudomonadota bacterium]